MSGFEATAEQRRTVRAMAGFGIPQADIATFLDLDPKTLRKHFRVELHNGSIEATAKAAQSLFKMATEGGSVAAAIFWMKARGLARAARCDAPSGRRQADAADLPPGQRLRADPGGLRGRVALRHGSGRRLSRGALRREAADHRPVQHRPTTVARW